MEDCTAEAVCAAVDVGTFEDGWIVVDGCMVVEVCVVVDD